MFSHRNIVDNILARCILYEFEDIIRQIDTVKMLAPKPTKFYKYGERIANRIAHEFPIALNPGIARIRVNEKYELFLTVCEFAKDLANIISLEGWRENCRTAVCYIDEMLLNEFMNIKCFTKLISDFDHVVVCCKQGVSLVQKSIRGKCLFLPPGVDALLFCPYPNPPERLIDVLSIGRRSDVTHKKLIDMVRENKIFYICDTTNGDQALHPKEHRLLLANLAKRSKYFIVNPGKINVPGVTGKEDLIGARFFEGAASGSIMIGEFPRNQEFKESFYWPDPVIHLPFDSDDIDEVISKTNMQPDRQELMRRNNIIGCLANHDWLYRWEAILNMGGLDPLPQLLERKRRLRDLSNRVEKGVLQ
jgi:hypothetical protein